MRAGIGYDVHRLVQGRPLIIGGVNIPFDKGLEGHSDADVLLHAVMDALLGAAGKGDIGKLFPPSDPSYKNISSMTLLEKVKEVLSKEGWTVGNIDSVIIAQKPKMAGYIEEMRDNIAGTLEMQKELINIKATTTEKLGLTGRGEGIAAQAIALLTLS